MTLIFPSDTLQQQPTASNLHRTADRRTPNPTFATSADILVKKWPNHPQNETPEIDHTDLNLLKRKEKKQKFSSLLGYTSNTTHKLSLFLLQLPHKDVDDSL